MIRIALLSSLCAAPLLAQDGGQLYTMYCSACHGTDGKGATGGQFPPLSLSPWVEGDAARAVKIVLHGLHGEVEVDGRTFNLEMPPQGGMLPDDQIAAILSHVRISWGNKESQVSADFVKSIRAANAERKTPWTAPELLKLHPLPGVRPPIANLLSQVYQGEWQQLPDFSKLTPGNIEEEHDGKISIAKAGFTELFGMVWQGDLTAPQDGEYRFRLDADDGARIILDGQEVVKVDGMGPMNGSRAKDGKIKLTAGPHKLRVEYFEYHGQEGIAIAWRGPGIPSWRSLTDKPPTGGPDPMPIAAKDGRAVVYRNFIAGTTPRAIGIGFPGGVNLAYSADHLAPELIWTGDFMDGSRHWVDRGQGDQPPAGEDVVKLSGTPIFPAEKEARFRGYKLDPAGNPTFAVQLGGQTLLDSWKPADAPDEQANSRQPALQRHVSLKGSGPALEILISDSAEAKPIDDQELSIGDHFHLHTEGEVDLIKRDGKTYLKLSPSTSATLDYRWKP
ncbi:PA14 domain-containing protein [Luteolibacter flavescens]|uniref:PA14 domain-containing protein n=1 Tax=Luteolibacter flavescens TaxID=1859460 RepID=A0ABT3FNY0_9BACT|nr:PA14 domain-containing protein [Luteolibacter flavescens]MCW1884695.1 PA14 domain-containing protein [Luteolibacter flavescens]